ncbi:MAG: DUF6448 family protein [Syntrophorhabdaceae bacterium]
MKRHLVIVATTLALLIMVMPVHVRAHCDTLDGPVVSSARLALEKGDITPVLKWVRSSDEKEIKEIFQKTLAARKSGPEAKEIADRYFFETLVRIHRAGEGAPYTGLQAGPAEPIIAAADKALETGSIDKVGKEVSSAVSDGINKRFKETLERKKHADDSVAAGRKYVEAYVDFTHYVERLHNDALAQAAHAAAAEPVSKGGHAH